MIDNEDLVDVRENTLLDPENNDYYLIDDKRYMRVTSALDNIGGEALQLWAAGLAADYAFENIDYLETSTRNEPCGKTYARCDHDFTQSCSGCPCETCVPCLRKKMMNLKYSELSRRAKEGSEVHSAIEYWTLFERMPEYDPGVQSYIDSFHLFKDEFGIVPDSFSVAEGTIVNFTHEYAGTTDGVIHLEPSTIKAAKLIAAIASRNARIEQGADLYDESIGFTTQEVRKSGLSLDLLLDWKTREKSKSFFPEKYALQLSAYRNAEKIILKKALDQQIDMPSVDGAIVVQLRPDGYALRPVVAEVSTFEAFLNLWSFRKWSVEYAAKSTQVKSFKVKSAKVAKGSKDGANDAKSTGSVVQPKQSAVRNIPIKPKVKQISAKEVYLQEAAGSYVVEKGKGIQRPDFTVKKAMKRILGEEPTELIDDSELPF